MLGPPLWSRGGDEHWVFDHWMLEFHLAMGCLVVAVALAPLMVICALAGNAWGGPGGNDMGIDIGVGIVTIAMAGNLLHLARMVSLRWYWFRNSHPRSSPEPETPLAQPPLAMRRVLSPTPADIPVQVLCAAALTALLLWINP